MHRLSTSFILGYHGCDRSTAQKLVNGAPFDSSNNEYDWLGPGVYFWEANPRRAFSYASEKRSRQPASSKARQKEIAVVGAVIELGLCLDLASEQGIDELIFAHKRLTRIHETAEEPLPQNALGPDKLMRKLDCAVIRLFHRIREHADAPPVDSVRGIFVEGTPIYEDAGFHRKTHIQICVCNPKRIKGVFMVPQRDLSLDLVGEI